MQYLKKIRVIFALIMVVPVILIFLDFTGSIPSSFISGFFSLQIFPGLTKLFTGITVASVGVLFVLILTLLFGRVYCSTICPLGTLQDVVIRLSGRIKQRRWYK